MNSKDRATAQKFRLLENRTNKHTSFAGITPYLKTSANLTNDVLYRNLGVFKVKFTG